MKLEEFIKSTCFNEIQISNTFFSPCLPKEALLKAIASYAKGTKTNQSVILIDEGGFFSSGEEGVLITNDEIVLSQKFGGRTISFDDITSIDISSKVLVINGEIMGVIEKSEVMPLRYLGSKLSEFFGLLHQDSNIDRSSDTVVSGEVLDAMKSLITKFQDRSLYNSVGLVSKENITENELRFIRFKLNLSSNEEIVALSWLDLHESRDEFFCITNDAVYSTKENVKISLNELKGLSVLDIYQESIYLKIKMSNDISMAVSRVYVDPKKGDGKPMMYTHLLLSELIELLNK